MENNNKSSSLSVLIIILVIVIFGAGIMWYSKRSVNTASTSSVLPVAEKTALLSDPAAVPAASVFEEIDNEIKTLDKDINTIKDDNFSDSILSDQEVGL